MNIFCTKFKAVRQLVPFKGYCAQSIIMNVKLLYFTISINIIVSIVADAAGEQQLQGAINSNSANKRSNSLYGKTLKVVIGEVILHIYCICSYTPIYRNYSLVIGYKLISRDSI